jgi:hypothetical protein
VLVYDSRIFVSSAFLAKEKNKKHVNFVASVMTAGALPNAAYLFEGNSTGYCGDDDAGLAPEQRLPCLVIAKRGGYADPGVLVPNPYFHDLQFWDAVRNAVKSRESRKAPDCTVAASECGRRRRGAAAVRGAVPARLLARPLKQGPRVVPR